MYVSRTDALRLLSAVGGSGLMLAGAGVLAPVFALFRRGRRAAGLEGVEGAALAIREFALATLSDAAEVAAAEWLKRLIVKR